MKKTFVKSLATGLSLVAFVAGCSTTADKEPAHKCGANGCKAQEEKAKHSCGGNNCAASKCSSKR